LTDIESFVTEEEVVDAAGTTFGAIRRFCFGFTVMGIPAKVEPIKEDSEEELVIDWVIAVVVVEEEDDSSFIEGC